MQEPTKQSQATSPKRQSNSLDMIQRAGDLALMRLAKKYNLQRKK